MKQNTLVISKIRVVYGVMFAVAGLLVLFSFRWQMVEASRFVDAAQGRIQYKLIPALRGTIYADDGTTLAYSEPRYDAYLWLRDLREAEVRKAQTREEFVSKVGPLLDYTPEQLKQFIDEQLELGATYFRIGKQFTLETREQLMALTVDRDAGLAEEKRAKLLGFDIQETSKRIYPEKSLASQVLGLTNQDELGRTIGLGGLEGEWDGNLEPLEGFLLGERDARGNAIGIAAERTIGAVRGNSVYTSLDKHLQETVEYRLKWAVEAFGASSGSVVIMDPKTGEVMAMANFPTYDPNLRESTDPNVYGNRAVSEPYEIGSVGKIFTLAAAIDSGVVNPDSVILQGHAGCEKIHDDLEPVCTHDKLPQPALPIKEAFELSDNIYFLHLGQLIPKETFYSYLENFGIGYATGVDLKGESYGYLKDWAKWNVADIAAYSYGHSYQVNLLQATSAVNALANRGLLMQPHLVKKVVQSDDKVIEFAPRPVEQVVKPETAAMMDEMMHMIYQNNIFFWEHHYDDLRNYKIALKSGTALIPLQNGLGYSRDINATYAGYDASPDRTFTMLVRLERPQGQLASTNARVLWLEIFRDIKDYLGIKRIGG